MKPYSKENAFQFAYEAFATSAVFGRRARVYKARLKCLDYFGIAVPLGVGGLVLGGVKMADGALLVLGVALTVQLLIFGWAAIAGWGELLDQATESRAVNDDLGQRYVAATEAVPEECAWEVLESQRLTQERIDGKADITQSEWRYGKRRAFWLRNWTCPACKETPKSMNPGDCENCGNFLPYWGKK